MSKLRARVPTRARVLAGLVEAHGWRRGVEVGVYKGETFRHLLTACPRLTLWGVDLFDSAFFAAQRHGRPTKTFDLESEMPRLQHWIALKAPGRGHLVKADTAAAAQGFADGLLDFVFIDADHAYESVHADISAWRPKVRAGGMVLGHDWNESEFPGVIRAVRELLGEPALHPDKVWAVTC